MTWRKRWALNWDTVLYCSDRCRQDASRARKPNGTSGCTAGTGSAATIPPPGKR